MGNRNRPRICCVLMTCTAILLLGCLAQDVARSTGPTDGVRSETALVSTQVRTSSSLTPTAHLPIVTNLPAPGALIQPQDLVYVGAFRLPDDAEPPRTFDYGGNAMTFSPDGDPTNADPYPGSLFITGHDRVAYGGLPDGNQVAEVSIPVPAIADDPTGLPQTAFLQGFHDVTVGYFTELEEIPKVGMQYLNHPATGPKIHLGWGVQRRNRIGPAAYDRDSTVLYVLEMYADGAKPVVYVWRVRE